MWNDILQACDERRSGRRPELASPRSRLAHGPLGLLTLALVLAAAPAQAENAPRDASSTAGYLIDYRKVTDGRTPEDLGHPVNTSSWTVYDLTNSTQMQSLGCYPSPGVANPANNGVDDGPAIRCAKAAPGGGGRVLYLPAGDYQFRSPDACCGKGVLNIARSNTVLRGAGIDQTVVRSTTSQAQHFQFGDGDQNTTDYLYGPTINWTAGFAAGTKVVSLASVAGLAPGDFVALRGGFPTWCNASARQYIEVRQLTCVGASGTDSCGSLGLFDVKLDLALRGPFNVGPQTVRKITSPQNIGVEQLTLKDDNALPEYSVAQFHNVVRGWLRNAKVMRGRHSVLEVGSCAYCVIEGSTIDLLMLDAAGNMRALGMGQVDESALVNNIVSRATVGIQLNQPMSVTGTIVAYNYLPNPPRKDIPGIDCVDDWGTPGACHPASCNGAQSSCDCTDDKNGPSQAGRHIFFHGPCHRYNLVEGNDVTCRAQWDDFWGEYGQGNLLHRNRARSVPGTAAQHSTGCIGPEFDPNGQEGFTLIANHAAKLRDCTGGGGVDGGYDGGNHSFWGERNVSYTECLVTQSGGSRDAQCQSAPGAVSSASTWTNNARASKAPAAWSTLSTPNSLIYDSKPSWWCDEACPWQASQGIGAFGDDNNGGQPSYCKLPAQIRAEGGTCTAPAPAAGGGTTPTPPAAPLQPPTLLSN